MMSNLADCERPVTANKGRQTNIRRIRNVFIGVLIFDPTDPLRVTGKNIGSIDLGNWRLDREIVTNLGHRSIGKVSRSFTTTDCFSRGSDVFERRLVVPSVTEAGDE